jgi:hypothetical protein
MWVNPRIAEEEAAISHYFFYDIRKSGVAAEINK